MTIFLAPTFQAIQNVRMDEGVDMVQGNCNSLVKDPPRSPSTSLQPPKWPWYQLSHHKRTVQGKFEVISSDTHIYINIVVKTTQLKITPDPFLPEEFANYHGTPDRWHQWQPCWWCWWRPDGKGAPCRTAQLRTWQRCQSLRGDCSMRYHFVFGRSIGISLGGIFTYLGPHSCGLLLVQRPPSMPSQTPSC